MPVDPEELLRIRDHMTSRGPDGAGVWISSDQCVGLAHRRLAIIELSEAGAQPMMSECGRLCIVFNGEIYNYRSLRAELEGHGVRFVSNSDTEVLLHLYRHCGTDMLARLRGMFAFVLWDEEKSGVLAARDHFGIKPLYVADDGTTLRFASQVKALLAGGAIDQAPDPAGHVGFFLWGHVPEPYTFHRNIRPLAAGTWLWADTAGGRREGTFFDMADAMSHHDRHVSELGDALRDSVRAHLEADVPVGLFLSSGLDSSTLTALMSEAAPGRLHTVTLGFNEFATTPMDEVPLAEMVAGHYRTDHRTERVDGKEFKYHMSELLHDMDQPSVDGVNTWFVARAARKRGLKVAVSGVGGDELFGGYDSFRQIPRLVNGLAPFSRLPSMGAAARMLAAPWLDRFTSAKWAGLLEYGTSFGGAYLLRRALFMPWELDKVLPAEIARAGLSALNTVERLNNLCDRVAGDHNKVAAMETACYMRNQLLRDADWAGMAHSLEIRTPLVDWPLFVAVQALRAQGREIHKRDMAGTARPPLPDAIINRKKTGFFVPVNQWLGMPNLRGWARNVYNAWTASA